MASLSRDFLAAGASVGELSEILVPEGWRFALTQSGEKLEVAQWNELLRHYRGELKELAEWRDEADDESWHELISADIHKFIATHRELNKYLPSSESLGDVYATIDATFAGTGAEFDGTIIALSDEFPDDDDDDEENEDEE